MTRAELAREADVVLMVGRPDEPLIAALQPGQAILGMLAPLADPELATRLAAAGRDGDQPGPDPADAAAGPSRWTR